MGSPRPLSLVRPIDSVAPEAAIDTIGRLPDSAIVSAGSAFDPAGNLLILAADARLDFEATGGHYVIRKGDDVERGDDPLRRFQTLLDDLRLSEVDGNPSEDGPPFQGGLIGYYGYDLAPLIENLPRKAARDSILPDMRFAFHDTFLLIDRLKRTVEFHAHDLLDEGAQALEKRLRRWSRILSEPPSERPRARFSEPRPELTRDEYFAMVARALEYIAAGDVFQVNISQRFSMEGGADPVDVFLAVNATGPAARAAMFRGRQGAIVSASPESFYQTRGRRIVTRPIKGTRRRGHDAEEDAMLVEDLRTCPKDRAELTMIIDLERNDLGRFCEYGSVRVSDAGSIETLPYVHHLVGTVEGAIRPEATHTDILRAMFPGGSITGAPKIRAMEIIDELEPTRRSAYTGAIGYYSRDGSSSFNIAIRTILVERDKLTYQVGAGIVADSRPDSEYAETLHKGIIMKQALESLMSDSAPSSKASPR